MPVYHLTFKEQIEGRVAVLLSDAGMTNCAATRSGLVAIIDSISRYQEEGQKLYPKIIITENIEKLRRFLMPLSDYIHIGEDNLGTDAYRGCIKKLAPLATDDWYILVERTAEKVNYGLICNDHSGLAVLPEQILRERGNESSPTPIILLRQIADGVVQADTANGHSLSVSFTDKPINDADRRPKLAGLLNHIVRDVDPNVRAELLRLLDRIFAWAIERGHGTLAVVLNGADMNQPAGLTDGAWLPEPISLADRVKSELDTSGGISQTSTRSIVNVIAGMLMSDGITIFDTQGKVRCYNAFAKPVTDAEMAIMTSNVGGARRRTFHLLRSWLGSTLSACLMVSQDGAVLFQD